MSREELSLEEVSTVLETIEQIIYDLKVSVMNLEIIEGEILKTGSILKHQAYEPFFIHHRFQLYFISIIQLDKLFGDSKNHKSGFIKLFNKLKEFRYSIDLVDSIKSHYNEKVGSVREYLKGRVEMYNQKIESIKDLVVESIREEISITPIKT